VFVHGADPEWGYPPIDLWCENWTIARYPLAWRTGGLGNNVIITLANSGVAGSGCVGFRSLGGAPFSGWFYISGAGYRDPKVGPMNTGGYLDLREISGLPDCGRMSKLSFYYNINANVPINRIDIYLEDTAGNIIEARHSITRFSNWNTIEINVGSGLPPCGFPPAGQYVGGATDYWFQTAGAGFNWIIRKIGWWTWQNYAAGDEFLIDGLRFQGYKIAVNPFDYPSVMWLPSQPYIDAPSVATYGRTVYHHEDDEIYCFEQAEFGGIGQRLVRQYKDPYARLQITQGFKPWVHPTEIVGVLLPTWNISGGVSGAPYRIEEVRHNCNFETNWTRTTVKVVSRASEIATRTAQVDTEGGLLKLIKDGAK